MVFYGAFDRYNYGDNLMPIVAQDMLLKLAPEIRDHYEFVNASISSSDLSRYDALKTTPIKNIMQELGKDDVLIVCGGEVIGAKSNVLFLHKDKPKLLNDLLVVCNKNRLGKKVVNLLAKLFYFSVWEYPYIPDPNSFSGSPRIFYNTVGGELANVSIDDRPVVNSRLKSASFLSVRDKRSYKSLTDNGIENVLMYPDSVGIIGSLYGKSHLSNKASRVASKLEGVKYFCYQSAPKKTKEEPEEIAEHLASLCRLSGAKVLLLPIGYANGHDDYYLLRKIHELMPEQSLLEYELTIWEIMYCIVCGDLYIGTSLHGAITALSYGVPHFGLNSSIVKLNDFLSTWSVSPFNCSYSLESVVHTFADHDLFESGKRELPVFSENINIQVEKHFSGLVAAIFN